MGTIRLEKLERDQNSVMRVTFDIRTTVGQLPLTLMIADRGSASDNEKQALRELKTHLQEALELVQSELERPPT